LGIHAKLECDHRKAYRKDEGLHIENAFARIGRNQA
jgi:hypothetical protein